jgi:AcrR family transcriptional regulator
MAAIRERSGASTGSIYHHFQSKEQLGTAVYLEGIQDWQAGFIDELEQHDDAREGIQAIVRFHLDWVRENPDWSRYLFQMRRLEFMSAVEGEIKQLNDRFFKQVGAWFRKHIEAGHLKKLPKELFVSILMGPCQDFARQLISGPSRLDLDRAARALGEAAWNSLKTEP